MKWCKRQAFVCGVLALCAVAAIQAAQTVTLRVEVRSDSGPVVGAEILLGGISHPTDPSGHAVIDVPPGDVELTVIKESFVPVTTAVHAATGPTITVVVELARLPSVEEQVTVVATTRTDRRLEDQPMRVEVLDQEEVEEKTMMTPGDVVMMLNETGGMRVQATSPSLGASSVRVQGMRGRYTRFFSDGLPLFGEVGGLGLLQIPPMDLGQVEVIKGVASSLYGSGAMGGVVNLISRRPGPEPERELLINRSSRGATDAVAWYSTAARQGWAFTLLGGAHAQERFDVDADGWADLPEYRRGVIRPRVFWNDGSGRMFFATAGFTAENRAGGGAAHGISYREALDTRRGDVGAVGQFLVKGRHVVNIRGAVSSQRHDHQFGDIRERDAHDTAFGEMTVRTAAGRHTIVASAAIERHAYRPQDVSRFAYAFVTPGVFIQDDADIARWLSISASARVDHHSVYGSFMSPRISALMRHGGWSSRVSAGGGFYAPTPVTEETEAAGLSRLIIASPLRGERGRSTSVDVTRTAGALSFTATAFRSRVSDPARVDRSDGLVLMNAAQPTKTTGVELLGTWRRSTVSVTANYAHVRAREYDRDTYVDTALTPRHAAGLVGMWERPDVARLGVELYYTGRQRLEESPYANTSRPYVVFGLLAERKFGKLRAFVNGENLTGVRQSRWNPLVRPTRAPDGRWTVDAWAPLDGRNINGGVRVSF